MDPLKVAGFIVLGSAVFLILFNWIVFPQTFIKFILFIMRHTVIRVKVSGKDNIPNSGPVLLVSNHISLIDLLLIQSVNHRRVRFMIRQEIYNFFPVHLLFRYLGVIPVPNAKHPKKMQAFIQKIHKRLASGEVLCLFPEGAISGNGNLMRFRSGTQQFLPPGLETLVVPIRIGMLHGRLLSTSNGKLKFNFPSRLPVDFNIKIGEPVDPKISAFEMRQKISELGAIAEKGPQPGEMPIHSAFLFRAKRHFFQCSYYDAATKTGINNFNLLLRSLIFSRQVKKLDPGQDGYVGVLMPNCTTMAALLLGVLFADRTPAIVNYSTGQKVAMDTARRAGIKTIFTSRRFLDKLKWEVTPEMVILEDLAPTIPKKTKIFWLLMTLLVPRRVLLHNVAPFSCFNMQRQAVLLFSSGSTGNPKGVMLTHRNINCDIWSFVRMIALNRNDKLAGNLPLFHAYGFTVQFAFPAQTGLPVIYTMNPLATNEILDAIEKYKITVLTATPTFLQKYIHKATAEQLESLRLVITGAEKLRKELADRFYELTGKEVIEGFGCTELSPIVAVNFNNSIFDMSTRSSHMGSIGCTLPGIHVRIIDPETGVELPAGKPGRMQVMGGTIMKGYLNNPEQTALVIQNGYYDTGDIARIDQDGFIYITGRASRFSKIGGEMVPHEAIEDIISKIRKSEVREVAVTGKADARKGEKLVVFYAPEDLDPAQVIEEMRNFDLPNIWLPKSDDFIKVDELPLLGSGKLDLRRLKEMADAL